MNVSGKCLWTLEGNCPKEINDEVFDCSYNYLKDLKGFPTLNISKQYADNINVFLEGNSYLEDISDLPNNINVVSIKGCHKIKIFTTEINNDNYCLTFVHPEDEVRKEIKEWVYYDVVEDTELYIKVKLKTDNILFMDSL